MGSTQERNVLFWTNPASNILQNSGSPATYLSSHKPSKMNKDMPDTAGEVRTKSLAMLPYEHLHMDVSALYDLQEFTYICFVWILDAV